MPRFGQKCSFTLGLCSSHVCRVWSGTCRFKLSPSLPHQQDDSSTETMPDNILAPELASRHVQSVSLRTTGLRIPSRLRNAASIPARAAPPADLGLRYSSRLSKPNPEAENNGSAAVRRRAAAVKRDTGRQQHPRRSIRSSAPASRSSRKPVVDRRKSDNERQSAGPKPLRPSENSKITHPASSTTGRRPLSKLSQRVVRNEDNRRTRPSSNESIAGPPLKKTKLLSRRSKSSSGDSPVAAKQSRRPVWRRAAPPPKDPPSLSEESAESVDLFEKMMEAALASNSISAGASPRVFHQKPEPKPLGEWSPVRRRQYIGDDQYFMCTKVTASPPHSDAEEDFGRG